MDDAPITRTGFAAVYLAGRQVCGWLAREERRGDGRISNGDQSFEP